MPANDARPSPFGDDRRRVLEATDIVRLVEEHVALKKKGREYVGKCPFHDDHKPSMFVVPAKQIYHCFSCGAGGNAIDFVVNYHKMDFIEALRLLADKASITLTPRAPRHRGGEAGGDAGFDGAPGAMESDGGPSRKDLLEASVFAHEFFRAILRHPEHGASARSVIERRGVSPEMAEEFGLGAAPERWDGLLLTAQKKGVRLDALAALGLLKSREAGSPSGGFSSGGYYDGFRNRLMFPIVDLLGRPIAFGGRKIREEDEPKYINSPESTLFEKSRTLFALPLAQRAIQSAGRAIIVEGYLDAMACHQAGVRNAVATLGTALTPEHARVLQRLCDEVVLVFDGDAAGARAADRAVEVFFAQPIDVRIATLASTGAKDPDELLKREGGREAFDAAIASATDALDYRFARLRAKAGGAGLSARARLVEEDAARLVELGLDRVSPVRKQLVIRRLAAIAGAPESAVHEAVARARRPARPAPEAVATTGESPNTAPLTDSRTPLPPAGHALGALLADHALWAGLSTDQQDTVRRGAYALGPIEGRLAQAASELLDQGEEPSLTAIMASIEDESARRAAARLAAHVETVASHHAGALRDSLHDAIRSLERSSIAPREPSAPDADAGSALDRQRLVRLRFGRSIPVIPRPDPRIIPG